MRTVVGRIVGAHALKGEFKVQPLTDYPERFYSMDALPIYRGDDLVCRATVERVRVLEGKDLFIVKCEEFAGPEAVRAVVGCQICVPADERAALREGEHWIDDLVGMSVVECGSGNLLGRVRDLVRNGGNELYLIDGEDGKEHLIPAVGEFVKDIDEGSRSISVALIEGLW